jgi:pimeloyl-ACP methyl ester carboxylesterase
MPTPAAVLPKKSTSVRLLLATLRAGFPVLGAVAPPLAARLAGQVFFTPPRHKTSEEEWIALSRTTPFRVPHAGGALAAWSWGEGPIVLLVHGWGSRGARLHSFVEPLNAAGYRVVAFDAPGHGDSPGRSSSLPQFAQAIVAVADGLGPIEAVITHSMGGPSTAFAMTRGFTAQRLVFVAPPANPGGFTQRFARALQIPRHVIERMIRQFERRFGLPWEGFDVPTIAPDMRSGLLVVHDRDDAEIPWAEGASIARAWPGAQLVTTRGLGHTRIVHDPEVVARSVAFLMAGRKLAFG